MCIDPQMSAVAIAALVSQTLEAAGIVATLSGGGAVTTHTDNQYASKDLDFVTAERREPLRQALSPLGFVLTKGQRHFSHPHTDYFLEFPAAPLDFGHWIVQHESIPRLNTPWGPLRVITPTLCVMDRLAAYWHWNDRQSWDQAVMVAGHRHIDFDELNRYALAQSANPADIHRLKEEAANRTSRLP